jgi:hypothetical protein
MSTEAAPYTLAEYIAALINELGAAHPIMLTRMRLLVGERHARIVLDDEAVEVFFRPEGLHVQPAAASDIGLSGEGATDSATVLELLDGYLEVSAAIMSDRLRVLGLEDDVVRMFLAIELLLDASPRTPTLQALAARFKSERRGRASSWSNVKPVSWYPFSPTPGELQLLAELDLLPDASA